MSTGIPAIKRKEFIFKIVTYAISVALGYLMIYPFIGLLIGDFGIDPENVNQDRILYLMPEFNNLVQYWKNFIFSFNSSVLTGFKNSMIVSCTSTIFCMYCSAITAYALTAYEWKLRQALDKAILIIVMLPSTVAIVGYYQLVWKFHMINRLSMLIFPAIASPVTILFMRLYLKSTFSKEIVESARIDGAGDFRIFNQIILPLLKPAIGTQAIFVFSTTWNDVFVPSIILIRAEKRTLPAINGSAPQLLYFLPPLLIFLFLQRYIVEGITLGSVKN